MNSVSIINRDAMTVKESDTSNVYQFQLLQGSKPQDLTDAIVNIVIENDDKIVLHRAVEVTDSKEGIITFRLSDEEYIGTGDVKLEFIVVYTNGIREVFPQKGYVVLSVIPRLQGEEIDLEPNNPVINYEYLKVEIDEVKRLLADEIGDIASVLDAINGEVK